MNAPLTMMENVFFSDPTLTADRRFAALAAAGFRHVYAVGYPLTDARVDELAQLEPTARCHGLQVSAVYASLDLSEPPEGAAAHRLARLLREVSGAPRIELSVNGLALPTADVIRRLEPWVALAEHTSRALALYPHSFYRLDSLAESFVIQAHFGAARLGVVFPVSHLYAQHTEAAVRTLLERHAAQIASFNFCGCRRLAPAVPAKVQALPPDEGDLSCAAFLDALDRSSYRGDVMLQGYGWTGDLPAALRRSHDWYRAQTGGR